MGYRPLAVVVVCSLIAVLLAGLIVARTGASDQRDSDVLVRLFGGTAEIASQSAMDQADLYLHAGTGHACGDCRHAEEQRAIPLPLHAAVDRLCLLYTSPSPRDRS